MAIIKCTCNHAYQDGKHGNKMRVHNYADKGMPVVSKPGWRCTVCTSVKPLSATGN